MKSLSKKHIKLKIIFFSFLRETNSTPSHILRMRKSTSLLLDEIEIQKYRIKVVSKTSLTKTLTLK